jgi:hypothetical protein
MSLIRNGEKKMTEGLYDFCNYINREFDTKKLTLLEIGTFNGESTKIFAEFFGEVTTVDPYNYELLDDDMRNNDLGNGTIQDIEEGFIENILNKYPNIIKIKSTSLDYAKVCEKIYDVIYIDAKHEYEFVIEDIKAWLSKCRLFMSGHDYLNNKTGVIKAVAEVFSKPDEVFKDHSWIVRIK